MRNRLTGVALVIIGALFLILAYLAGWTSSNLVLLGGLLIIIIGIILHVKLTKSGQKY
jgi:membrane-bound ClpP family serine protease